jgi:hypothetical protein
MQMKAGEIIRVIVFSLIGAVLMFWVQPLLYQSRIIRLADVPRIEAWVSNYYMIAAAIVFAVSLISTVIWCVMAALAPHHKADDVAKWSLIWWIIGIFPVVSICVAIGFFKGSNDALLSLTALFILDILWIYWWITATSTPGLLMNIPPFAFPLRRLIGDS